MQKQNIANILLYNMTSEYAPTELGADKRIISEIVDGWNQNIYVYPKYSIKLNPHRTKKYNLM